MSKKLTPWFPVKVKPVREGEYDYRGYLLENGVRMLWNGRQWGYWLNPRQPFTWVHMADATGDEWRGLAKEPK